MKVRFWGTRGSIAKAGPSTVKFGGNTSCIEVRSKSGTLVVLDCGTGAHGLGQALMKSEMAPMKGHILITHTHWDHIQGLPFFAPLFVPGNEWDIYAPQGLGQSLQETLAGQMQYTYFPVRLDGLGATIHYHDLVEGAFEIDDISVQTHYLNHPALTLGYRLQTDGVSAVYACDHEPFSRKFALGRGPMGDQDRQHVAFLDQADLAIHDAQYTDNEYAAKIGWGHTPMNCAVDMCHTAGVRRLALTHHDPMRTDDDLERQVEAVHLRLAELSSEMEVFAAAEGMEIELEGEAVRPKEKTAQAFSALSARQPAVLEHRVLVGVADAAHFATIFQALSEDGLVCLKAVNADEVLTLFRAEQPSLVVLDAGGAGGDVTALCKTLREIEGGGECPVIFITDPENTIAENVQGEDGGVTDWLVPPFTQGYARTRLRAWVMRTACRWQQARVPSDEEKRLTALKKLDILDTEAEERFDRITRIAALAFDVPIALVSLVDKNRQWFKSCVGVDISQTPRDQAFCAHAILEDDILVIPDALLDPRFADNPLVTGAARVRFYAGYPLSLADGSRVGTLCLIDTQPRPFDDRKAQLLKDLGALVEAELGND